MSEDNDKKKVPPYTSYITFKNFIKGLHEAGMPSRIDRSILSGMSGSQQSSIISACEWFNLISSTGIPTPKMSELAASTENKDNYTILLTDMLKEAYAFIEADGFDLERVTGQQLADEFRKFEITGSTLTKAVTFFLKAAEDSQLKVSPHAKPPRAPRTPRQNGGKTGGAKRRHGSQPGTGQGAQQQPPASHDPEILPEGMERITVSLRNMKDGIIYFPAGLEGDDARRAVKAAIFNLKNYYGLDDED